MASGIEVGARQRCASCERVKDAEQDFAVKQRHPDGTVRRRFNVCRSCQVLRVRIPDNPRLPVEPLRDWLARRLQDEGVWDLKKNGPVPDHRAPRSIEEIARDWGTSAKRLQNILKLRVDTVAEDFADRLLTNAGSPHLLGILWDRDEDLAA